MSFPWDVLKWAIRATFRLTPPAASDGELVDLQADANGNLKVVVVGSSNATYSYHVSPALTSQGAIKTSAGSLRQLIVTNTGPDEAWLVVCNNPELPGSSEALVAAMKLLIRVPGTDTVSLPLEADIPFSTGIYWVAFTTAELEIDADPFLKVHAFYS